MSQEEKYQVKLQQEIERSASFMNTTKWKTLFSILKNVNFCGVMKVKLLLDEKIRTFTRPDLNTNVSEKYIEQYWGVFELKEIEWVFIPSEINIERKNRTELLTSKTKLQNIEPLVEALQKGKQFEYETSEEGLKIYGYR